MPTNRHTSRLSRFARIFSGTVAVVVGFLVLVGWSADIQVLKSVWPGLATMKVNTACLFVLTGVSLWVVSQPNSPPKWERIIGLASSVAVLSISLLTLTQDIFSVDFGIDQLLVRVTPNVNTPYPGRMAVVTAATFSLVGFGLFLLQIGFAGVLQQVVAVAALLISSLCCLSYLYGFDSLHSVAPFSSVAVHTAVTFLLVSVGVLATPGRGIVALLESDEMDGILLRRLLPVAVLFPALTGWLRLRGQQVGWFGFEFGLALFVLSNITLFVVLVLWAALRVGWADEQRRGVADALGVSERRSRLLLEGVPQLVWTCRTDGWCDYLSRQWVEYTGIPEANQLGYEWSNAVHPDDRPALLERWEQSVRDGGQLDVEFRIRSGSGEYRWFKTRAVLFSQADGESKWFGTNTDIHDKKLAEDELRESNARLEARVAERTAALMAHHTLLKQFIKHLPAAVAMFDREVRYVQFSDRWLSDYNLSKRNIIGLSHYNVFPDIPDRWKAIHQRVLAGAVEKCDEDPFEREDGSTEWLQWECRPWQNAEGGIGGLIVFTQVITERKQAEEQIKTSLREKEVLLKEIHHRVKNNLQIVSTLLDLQSKHTTDRTALSMFKESRGRVKSMALIHERLYRSQDMSRVDFAEYVRQLAADLYRTYKVSHADIGLELDVDIPPLTIDIAIPCGLLLNELMSNCLKHAFKDTADGCVWVALHGGGAEPNVLTVADNGAGFPDGTDFRNTTSFGMQLVVTLVEQLNGEIELIADRGTKFTVRFPTTNTGRTGDST